MDVQLEYRLLKVELKKKMKKKDVRDIYYLCFIYFLLLSL